MSDAELSRSTEEQVPAAEMEATTGRPGPPPARRRDKPQLSCNACRRRKVRCDRLHPCSNCASRGLGTSCFYASAPATLPSRSHGGTHVQARINQLEVLVLNLMQHTAPSPQASSLDKPDLSPGPQEKDQDPHHRASPRAFGDNAERSETTGVGQIQREVSPSPSDYGSIRIRESGVSYVSSAHWAAVLDSIAELRDHFEQEDESHALAPDTVQPQVNFPSPQLLYGGCPLFVTPASVLESMPPRPVVDRLVSRYFSVLDMASGVPHSGKFLREYEEFWKAPQATPIMWVGLLFSMMCLSTQFQQVFLAPANTLIASGRSPQPPQAQDSQQVLDLYREKTIQCLILAHYTKGGPYVLETLILYFMVEVFLSKDTEVGSWILVGNIVQIAIHSGYHRDAKHFPNISPFAGEMRRRVWALIVQLDFMVSTQLGLPRLIKESQTDTAEPRNLADADFDEFATELPPSRPETEMTPALYTLAKLRFLSVGVKVADVATEPRPFSYTQILELDKQLDEARDALPSCLKWDGIASCIAISSQIIVQRIWLEVCIQRQKIVLHKRFLVASRLQPQYTYSRSASLTAAMKILELQHLVDEETQIDGLLYQNRWRVTSSFIHDFLLATSTLCFYLQIHDKEQEEQQQEGSRVAEATPVDIEKIGQLLRASQVIWVRESAISKEARKAAAALRHVLGDSGFGPEPLGSTNMTPAPSSASTPFPYFPGFSDLVPGYDLSSLGLEPANEGLSWGRFSPSLNNDIGSWTRADGLEHMNMDLSS